MSITELQRSLQRLAQKNAVEYFEYSDGTRLYGCSVPAQAFLNAKNSKSEVKKQLGPNTIETRKG